MRYAVLDLETTGIYPGGHDRIVELAVVTLDSDLSVDSEFTSLLNPDRDVGPTWLHGVRASDVLDAPTFEELAGALIEHFQEAVIVGHNITFDLRFLESEFSRVGARIERPPYLDTMSAALRAGAASRRLEVACDLFGIALDDSHSALADAHATAILFGRCAEYFGLSKLEALVQWPGSRCIPRWPHFVAKRQPWPRARAAARRREEIPFLARLVRDLPVSATDSGAWHPYYALLDRALEDRRISETEAAALRDVATETGLTAGDVRTANETYLRTLVATAYHDGVLSDLERRDLKEVARLLALEPELPEFLQDVADDSPPSQTTPGTARKVKGRTVCFTGAMNAIIEGERATRERATEIAEARGMVVVKGVTKALDYLVLADPDSQSGKAKKARRYGTRLLAESVFWTMMGVQTDGRRGSTV